MLMDILKNIVSGQVSNDSTSHSKGDINSLIVTLTSLGIPVIGNHIRKTDVLKVLAGIPKKYEHLDFTPPEGVRKAAKRGLELLDIKSAGTPVGWARARDLSAGRQVSPETIKRMYSFFSRHQSNKSSESWKNSTPSNPSKSYIAWMLWGGDPGFSWARKMIKSMEAADNKVE